MNASVAGLTSAILFGIVAMVLGLLSRKVPWKPKVRAVGVAVALGCFIIFVPPPLVLAGRAGYFSIIGGGHAGQDFLAPYFVAGLLFIIVAAWISGRDSSNSTAERDARNGGAHPSP